MQSLWLPPTPALPLPRCLCGALVEPSQVGAVHCCCPRVCTNCTHTHWDECFSPGCMAVKHWHCCAAAASGVRSSRCHSCGNKQGRVTFPVCGGVNCVCEMAIARLLPAAHLSSPKADDSLCNCSLCPFCQE